MFKAQKLRKLLWTKTDANAVYTLIRCLTRALQSVTPIHDYG